jgi:hypothetical protein
MQQNRLTLGRAFGALVIAASTMLVLGGSPAFAASAAPAKRARPNKIRPRLLPGTRRPVSTVDCVKNGAITHH